MVYSGGGGKYPMLGDGDVPRNTWKSGPKFWQRTIEKDTHNSGALSNYRQNSVNADNLTNSYQPYE